MLLAGCTAEVSGNDKASGSGATPGDVGGAGGSVATGGTGGTAGSVGTTGGSAGVGAGGTVGGTGGSAATGGTGALPANCQGTDVAAAKRIIRLSFNQIVASIRVIFGDVVADTIATKYEVGDLTRRTFPPLANPREGSTITDTVWQAGDNIAQDLGKHVFDNFATITGCTATPTDQCARDYVLRLAAQAYRRPLTAEESTRLIDGVYVPLAPGGGVPVTTGSTVTSEMSIQDAVRYSAYAIFESPHFLYRTELGGDSTVAGPLAPYELASELSYYLTDGPPDQLLLDAAAQNALATPDQVAAQATRLLATPEARENLSAAMFAYFTMPVLETITIDSQLTPAWTNMLRGAMYHEADVFLRTNLWNGTLDNMLTTRQSIANAELAALYGVSFPPAGVTPGQDGFAPIDLPADRTGLLTLSGFLTQRSNPEIESVVKRGVLVNDTILCGDTPPFPEDQETLDKIEAAGAALANASEKEKADYRGTTPPCNGCHLGIDPFGMALENYDLIGRYRTMDAEGRPVDPTTTLPENAGSLTVTTPVEMANALVATGAFATCFTTKLLAFALAEVPPTAGTSLGTSGCATGAVTTRYATTGKTFSDLAREIAASTTLSTRAAGVNQ
jgi:hypothetical protein